MVDLRVHDLRAYAEDLHRSVDDAPYGGGPGMLMRPEPWGRALDAILDDPPPTATAAGSATRPAAPLLVVPTPSGRRFGQADAQAWTTEPWLIIGVRPL